MNMANLADCQAAKQSRKRHQPQKPHALPASCRMPQDSAKWR
jgi:hypothetical protein